MNNIRVHISAGNSKMGSVPSFSLPSGLTCSAEACKTCFCEGCYARKLERFRPSVHRAYAENFALAREDLPALEAYLNWFFASPSAPRLFRVHVSGDFFSADYLSMWLRVAASHPDTRFLAFTKQYALLQSVSVPANFRIVLSAWPGVELPAGLADRFPVAWMQDGRETRVPADAFPCSGNCAACGECWKLAPLQNVVFRKH